MSDSLQAGRRRRDMDETMEYEVTRTLKGDMPGVYVAASEEIDGFAFMRGVDIDMDEDGLWTFVAEGEKSAFVSLEEAVEAAKPAAVEILRKEASRIAKKRERSKRALVDINAYFGGGAQSTLG